MTLSDYLTSVIRSTVPALWGTALAWLVSFGILDQATAEGAGAQVGVFLVAACIGLFYAGARAIEPHIPAPFAALLFGASRAPAYSGGDHRA